MVSKRDRQIERLGRSKWLALLFASVATFRRHLNLHVRMNVRSGGRSFASGERSTPFVFVGNNAYAMDLLNLGKREAIDRGELCLYVTCRGGRLTMLALALRAIFGRLEQSRDFESVTGEEVLIDARKKTLRVSVDGEVERMTPPLDYRIRPGALTVFVPRTPGLGKPGA
jgi:diacylglycerol kinase family enzyme